MSLKKMQADFIAGTLSKQDYINQMHEVHKMLFEYSTFIRGTDIKNIEITDDCVIMTTRTDAIKLICDRDDKRIIPIEILNFGSYEDEVFLMMKQLIDGDCTVFDIGGNIGWYALNIAKAKQRATIHTFEPIPKTYSYLKQNIALNGVNNVIPHNFGYSNEEQELVFYYYPEVSGNASLADLSGNESVEKITCQVKKLDDYVAANQLTVDFIKCDVEGAELFVFQGGLEVIKNHRPIVFAELLRKWSAKFNYHPNEVIQLLSSCGYCCFISHGSKLVRIDVIDELTMETNFFFLHEEKHSDKIKMLCD